MDALTYTFTVGNRLPLLTIEHIQSFGIVYCNPFFFVQYFKNRSRNLVFFFSKQVKPRTTIRTFETTLNKEKEHHTWSLKKLIE